MRPEEGCGLKWKCVSFDDNLLVVENAYKDVTIYDDDMNIIGHKCQDGDLKTEESYRTISIAPRLRKMLINLKNDKIAMYEKEGKKWNESDYVFLNTTNGPYVPERLTTKMANFIRRYKLEHMTVYGLRHSFATLNSEKGMDKEVLREIMGHADFETTEFYYIFISDKRKQEEFKKASDKSFEKNTDEKFKLKGKKFVKKKIKAPMKISA